jgi:hypothetical protein
MINEFWLTLIVSLISLIAKRLGAKSTTLGDYGLYIVTFIVGLIFAGFEMAWKFIPIAWAEIATTLWGGAMLWYEVLLKRIPAVKKLGEPA